MLKFGALTRRTVLATLGSAFASGVTARPLYAIAATNPTPTGGTPFDRTTVTEAARKLAQQPFKPPSTDLPKDIDELTYDEYRDIYFDTKHALWAGEGLPFQLQLFHRGFYYKERIEVAIVEDGKARHLAYSPDLFGTGEVMKKPLPDSDIGFAGIRIHGHINSPDRMDEVAVFLGASYFRSVGKDQSYGISARGLTLNTGGPGGEEFPLFRAFWVEKPQPESDVIVVNALLDSKSTTGAYRFSIRPGTATVMDVEATLFPREDLEAVGLAPGTSMFYFDGNGRTGFDDWRPQVHDSNGLLILNGRGERLWRPLANPKALQYSAFVDNGVRGFGLMQRARDYDDFLDYTAHYEKRPSLWAEPHGDWGKGSVVLIEIPSQSEINDNIVAFWQPATPIAAGSEYSFAYRLSWGVSATRSDVSVVSTRHGRGDLGRPSPVRRFVIDYADTVNDALPEGEPLLWPSTHVTASAGVIKNVAAEPNPVTGGWRLSFNLDPEDEELVEIRAVLEFADHRTVDTWVYRWTA